MHFRTIAFAIAFPLLVALATPASAVTSFTATLTGANEAPANASTATGFATFVLNDAQTELSVSVTVFGLDFTGTQTPANVNDNLLLGMIRLSIMLRSAGVLSAPHLTIPPASTL